MSVLSQPAAAGLGRTDAAVAISTIRGLAIDAVEAAGSGHPELPLAMAPAAYSSDGRPRRSSAPGRGSSTST